MIQTVNRLAFLLSPAFLQLCCIRNAPTHVKPQTFLSLLKQTCISISGCVLGGSDFLTQVYDSNQRDCCIFTRIYRFGNFVGSRERGSVSVSDRSTHFTSEQQPLQPNPPTHTHTHALPSPQATLHCLQLMRAAACAVDARRAALPSLISALCHVSTLNR